MLTLSSRKCMHVVIVEQSILKDYALWIDATCRPKDHESSDLEVGGLQMNTLILTHPVEALITLWNSGLHCSQ